MNTTDSLTDAQIATLKAAALAATPQNIDSAQCIEHYDDGSHVACPACGGEGHVELEADFCNYDGTAIGVQFYGIGNAHGAAEAYLRAASPANVLALIERLERAEASLATTPQTDGATAALTDEQIINIADSYSFTWDEGIIAFARALLAATHAPAMAETQTDAARYRWLRNEHFPTADNPPLAQVVWKAFDSRHSSDWANMIDGNDLDRAIDAAIAAASGGEQESQS